MIKFFPLISLEEPGSPVIVSSATNIQATSLTVKWTATVDDGGSPITAYRVVILKGSTEIKNVNITDPGITSLSVGDLERNTEYNVKVFARNAVFEGAPGQKTFKTKVIGKSSISERMAQHIKFYPTISKQYLEYCFYSGIPETPDIIDVPAEIHSDEVVIKWTTPSSNGADITKYILYIRNVTSSESVGDWRKIDVISDVSIHTYVVTLRKGQRYDLVVTATNKYGESLKEKESIKRIRVLGGTMITKYKYLTSF